MLTSSGFPLLNWSTFDNFSLKLIGHFPAVLNFNWLFLKPTQQGKSVINCRHSPIIGAQVGGVSPPFPYLLPPVLGARNLPAALAGVAAASNLGR
jgi:hypothetical protein